jgi:hypothetical protein
MTYPAHRARFHARRQSVLRAYATSPIGEAVPAIMHTLAALDPFPTMRQAIRLTDGLPARVQSAVLARFPDLPSPVAILEALENTPPAPPMDRTEYLYRKADELMRECHGPEWEPGPSRADAEGPFDDDAPRPPDFDPLDAAAGAMDRVYSERCRDIGKGVPLPNPTPEERARIQARIAELQAKVSTPEYLTPAELEEYFRLISNPNHYDVPNRADGAPGPFFKSPEDWKGEP